MYENLTECPVCGSENYKNHLIVQDYSISQESFSIVKCDTCSFQFTNPRPPASDIGKYYASDEYISHTNKGNNPINLAYKMARTFALRSKVNLINTITKNKKGRLLDYGCGTGHFLHAITKNGWKTVGLEPDKDARNLARQQTPNSKIYKSLYNIETSEKKFNIITLWHVLEHIHDLNDTLQTLKSRLKQKGKLVVAVPNISSLDAQLYKQHWAAYDVPRHLYHFNQEAMKTLMLKHGMKVKKTYPMPLDAYYISMLSEKYKTGKANYFKAFQNGYKSNQFAKQNKTNYSSIIYEIKK
jgi:2-polyprenyl-3-methyl-5-hydroxy-6-metoxy-1,4-benzoquinol methylase